MNHKITVAGKPLDDLIPADASKVGFSRRGDSFQLDIEQTEKWTTDGAIKIEYQQVTQTTHYIGLAGSLQASCVYEKDAETVKQPINVHDLAKERARLRVAPTNTPEPSRIIHPGAGVPRPIKIK
jgi:hypothetical protein